MIGAHRALSVLILHSEPLHLFPERGPLPGCMIDTARHVFVWRQVTPDVEAVYNDFFCSRNNVTNLLFSDLNIRDCSTRITRWVSSRRPLYSGIVYKSFQGWPALFLYSARAVCLDNGSPRLRKKTERPAHAVFPLGLIRATTADAAETTANKAKASLRPASSIAIAASPTSSTPSPKKI